MYNGCPVHVPRRPWSHCPDRIPNWCDKVPGSVPFLCSGFLKRCSDLFLPSLCPFLCYPFHDKVRFKWGKRKKEKKKNTHWARHPTIGYYYDCWILTVATRRAGRTERTNQTSKSFGYKSGGLTEMRSVAARQLSSCKIIAQSPLLRRHGFRLRKETGLPVEAFRSCHSEKHDSVAKNNVRL